MIKKWNSFNLLLVVTIIMVVLMFVTIYRTHNNQAKFGLLYPSLFSQLGDVDTIKFDSPKGKFELHRKGNNWYIKDHYDYLANYTQVKRMLVDMSHTKIIESKTANPKLYSTIGVEGSSKDSNSLTITLSKGDKQVAGMILGKERPSILQLGPKDFYVRRVGDKHSWLVQGYLLITPIMLHWMQTQVVNIARERIARVDITQPNGTTATIVNLGEKGQFGMLGKGKATQFIYPQLGYDIAGSFHKLNIEDVKPKADFKWGDYPIVTAKFTTFGGLVITAKTVSIKGQFFTQLSASYDPSVVTPAPDDIKALNVIKTPEQIKAEVIKMNQQLSPWVYQVSGFIGTNLMRLDSDIEYSNKPQPAPLMQQGQQHQPMNGFSPH